MSDNFTVQPPNTLSQVIITPLQQPRRGTVALANVTVDDTITINSIALKESKYGGLYVKMPAKLTTDGTYIDVAHPFNSKVRQTLNDKLIDMYETGQFTYIDNATSNKKYSPQVRIVNCSKYSEGNTFLARADLVVSSFVVHNGNLTISMPAYLSYTGEYRSIVVPKTKNAYQLLNKAYINEYNTEYMYKRATDDNIKQLKKAGVEFQLAKSATDNLIKFKATDANKVMSVINQATVSAPKIIG